MKVGVKINFDTTKDDMEYETKPERKYDPFVEVDDEKNVDVISRLIYDGFSKNK